MARIVLWLSLVTYAAATMHMGEGGGGGNSLPFDLPMGKEGGGQGMGMGMGLGQGLGQNGQNLGLGNGEDKGSGGGKGLDISNQLLGDGQKEAGSPVNVIVLWTNEGGGAQNQVVNEPQMQEGMTHQVVVGGDAGLIYAPESVQGQPGDMIEFTFMSQNHTVTQSTFTDPCTKMEAGFDSGFIPNPDNTVDPPPAMMFQITSPDPVWMYCAQGSHCQDGMVFSVNPTAEKSQEMFKQMAMDGAAATGGAGGGGVETGGTSAPPPLATSSIALRPEMATPSVAAGEGNAGNGEPCSCSCLCGMEAWPAGAGAGAWGGMGGSVPMGGSSAKRQAIQF